MERSYSEGEHDSMKESQSMQELEPSANDDAADNMQDEVSEDGENEKELDVPFGLLGASFLCNLLQYAVFLGLTMVVLIIIRVFMPMLMGLR
jgi:hypothetical protein